MDTTKIKIDYEWYVELDTPPNFSTLHHIGCSSKGYATADGIRGRGGKHCNTDRCRVTVPDEILNKFRFITNQ